MTANEMLGHIAGAVSDSFDADRANEYLNDACEWLEQKGWWRHLEVYPPYQLLTVAPYTTGTIALTAGSTAVVGTGTAFAAGHVGQVLQVEGESTWYYLSAVADAEHMTLRVGYAGDTASDLAFTIWSIRYATPSDLSMDRVKALMLQDPAREVLYIDETERQRQSPNMLSSTGSPQNYTLISDNDLIFWPPPDAAYVVDVMYQRNFLPVTTDRRSIDFPETMHRVIQDYATAVAWRDKNDEQALECEQRAEARWRNIAKTKHRSAGYTPKMRPFDNAGRRLSGLVSPSRVTGDPFTL